MSFSRIRLVWIEVRDRLGQLATAVAVIALAVALAAGTLAANEALLENYQRSLDALAGNADLQVVPASGGTFPEEFLEQVRSVPGVEAAAAMVSGISHLPDQGDMLIRVVGVDLLDDAAVRVFRGSNGMANLDDPLIFLNQPSSILMPRGFAERHGIVVGDGVRVEAPAGGQTLRVRGLLEEEGAGEAFGGMFVVMDIYAAQDTLDASGRISQIDVVAPEPEAARRALRESLPSHISILTVAERKAELQRMMEGLHVVLNGIAFMGIILAALIVSNRLATVYQSRLWEIGVMRAMGRSPARVTRRLLGEAAFLSVLGTIIGLPLAVGMAQLMVTPLADSMVMSLKQAVFAPTVPLTARSITLAALAGIAGGVLAAWVPARHAAHIPVVAVLGAARRRSARTPGLLRKVLTYVLPPLALLLMAAEVTYRSSVLSGVAMVVVYLGAALLVQPALRLVTLPIARLAGEKRSIGLKDQSRFPSRGAGAALVLMSGVAVVLWISSAGRSFEEYVAARDAGWKRADLIVQSVFTFGPERGMLSEEVLHEVTRLPGVAVAAAERIAMTKAPGSDAEIGIYIVDPAKLTDPALGTWNVPRTVGERPLERVASGDAILANQQFLETHGLALGGTARLLTPSGVLEVDVVGETHSSFISQSGDIVLSRDVFKTHWGDSSIGRLYVLVEEGSSIEGVRSEIEKALGPTYPIEVVSTREYRAFVKQSVRAGFSFANQIGFIILLVIAIGTADALAADVIERAREIGTLRALGFTPASVSMMIAVQTLAIALVGISLGLIVGAGMGLAFVQGMLPDIIGWDLEMRYPPDVALFVSLVGIIACLAGALFPALKGARLSPVEALRSE